MRIALHSFEPEERGTPADLSSGVFARVYRIRTALAVLFKRYMNVVIFSQFMAYFSQRSICYPQDEPNLASRVLSCGALQNCVLDEPSLGRWLILQESDRSRELATKVGIIAETIRKVHENRRLLALAFRGSQIALKHKCFASLRSFDKGRAVSGFQV